MNRVIARIAERHLGKTSAQSADVVFKERFQLIQRQIRELQKHLQDEAREQARNPLDWGYAGDLGHVTSELKNLISFLS